MVNIVRFCFKLMVSLGVTIPQSVGNTRDKILWRCQQIQDFKLKVADT